MTKSRIPGGDLRAVVKTVAELEVETDRPLKDGLIELNDGTKIDLESKQGNILVAKVPIEKDGAYHFAAKQGGEDVRITQDYFIEAKADDPPSVKITHPGADAKVSPIEEVTVTVTGSDDFALQGMDLHYSVNGQAEKVVPLLKTKGSPTAEGKVVLYLEDFNLVPGDIVSMYATANDARSKTVGDITFIEAQPYERNFSQSQQGGGGGGGGGGQQNDPSQITQREKEIIAATHNFNRGGKNAQANAENAQYLSEVQAKLKDQAESMAKRTTARELSTENQDFQSFTKEMEAAAAEMTPAADKLKAQKWSDALEPENKALQHLSRAMATFRDIQVARGQGGGGGGGGGAGCRPRSGEPVRPGARYREEPVRIAAIFVRRQAAAGHRRRDAEAGTTGSPPAAARAAGAEQAAGQRRSPLGAGATSSRGGRIAQAASAVATAARPARAAGATEPQRATILAEASNPRAAKAASRALRAASRSSRSSR